MAFNFGNLFESVIDVVKPITSVIPGVGSYWSSQEASEATRDANAKNLQAVRETNAANYNLWKEQTAYNTPINQMQRLRDAGLNPNLAYGQVADSRMATAPTLESPKVQPVPARDYGKFNLSEFAQVYNMMASNALTRANIEKVHSDTALNLLDLDWLKKNKTSRVEPQLTKIFESLMKKSKDFADSGNKNVSRSSTYQSLLDLVSGTSEWWNSPSYLKRLKADQVTRRKGGK